MDGGGGEEKSIFEWSHWIKKDPEATGNQEQLGHLQLQQFCCLTVLLLWFGMATGTKDH